jgi:O-antigen/teichoic acid export membrane protein
MQVFSNILLIFFTLGLERAIYRLYHDYKTEKEQKDFLGTVSISIAVISLFVGGILFLLNGPIGRIYKSIDFHPYYTYAILTALFMTYELVPKISFQVKEQANKFLVLSLIILAFRVLPVIWQVVYLKAGAVGMLKGAMIGNAASLIFIIPLTIKQINLRVDFQILKSTLKYCLPFIPMIVSSWVVNMSDRIFIERYFSTYDVGIYSLGYKIGQLVQFLSVSILMAYNPYFYKLANSADQITAKKKLYKVNNASIVFLMFVGFLVALFSKDIVILFFNEKYHETYKIIPFIVLGYFFMQLISLQNLSFYQVKKTIAIMRINIVAAIINISLNILLISKYSFYGAAISTVLTQLTFFIIIYYYSRRYYFIPYSWKLILPLFIFFILITLMAITFLQVSFSILILKICIILLILGVLIIKNKEILLNTLNRK